MSDPKVLVEVHDGLGVITLNRPKAINALDHAMARTVLATLREWADEDAVRTVVIAGAGERGLCAGGDVVTFHDDAKNGRTGPNSASGRFFRDEYTLNAYIARYPKPYVALMDGYVLGGGVGLSAHAAHRVVTERSRVGMPEVTIGLVPDVGGTYLLSRAPGELGTYLALTADNMTAGDAIACGFADYYVPAERIPALLDALRSAEPEIAIAKFTESIPVSELAAQRDWIDACFSAETVTEIVDRLQRQCLPAATRALAAMAAKSPLALAATLRSLRAARVARSLEEVLNQDYRASVAALATHDLREGIRAQVIDKDRNPRWSPINLAEVTTAQVDAYFAELGAGELGLTTPENA